MQKNREMTSLNIVNGCVLNLLLPTKKWICFSIYRPPALSNLSMFIEELTISLSMEISPCSQHNNTKI